MDRKLDNIAEMLHIKIRTKKGDIKTQELGGNKALIDAVISGNVDTVKTLVDKGVYVNVADADGNTALMLACAKGQLEIAKILLNNKRIDVGMTNGNKDTALLLAAQNGHVDIVNELIINGAGINATNSQNCTPLIVAARDGHDKVVEALLKVKNIAINTQSSNGDSALMLAVQNGHTAIVKTLLDNKADINLKNAAGSTALMIAVSRGDSDIKKDASAKEVANTKDDLTMVEALLAKGADVNAKNSKGKTALMIAASKGNIDIVKALLGKGADLELKDSENRTALFKACAKGHADIVKLLIDKGADILAKNSEGNNALHAAASNGYTEVVKLLLDSKKIDINEQNSWYETPLASAAWAGHADVVQLLLDKGADPSVGGDKVGSPSILPFTNKKSETAKLMMDLSIKNNEKKEIPLKSCLITLSTGMDDFNGGIAEDFIAAMGNKVIAICRVSFLNKIITDFPFMIEYFISPLRKFSLFVENNKNLFVVIPGAIDNAKDYGFTNVTLISSQEALKALESEKDRPFGQAIQSFKSIIDTSKENHPKRFLLTGHGGEDLIADIPMDNMKDFFLALADIDAEFLHIMTCNAGGTNIIKMQDKINDVVKINKLNKINYIIIIDATTDTSEFGAPVTLHNYFITLDMHLRPLQKGQKEVTIKQVIKSLGLANQITRLQSIRFPGHLSNFRSIDLDEMEIITFSRVRALRAQRMLSPVIASKQPAAISANAGAGDKGITIEIKADPKHETALEYVQIFPCNLSDCTFDIKGSIMPKFISKLPGQGQVFIGKIIFTSSMTDRQKALEGFVERGFTKGFGIKEDAEYEGLTNKCWFIRSLELTVGGQPYNIDHLVISMPANQAPSYYIYHDASGFHKGNESCDEQTYRSLIGDSFIDSIPSQQALDEATASNEQLSVIKNEVVHSLWGEYLDIPLLMGAVQSNDQPILNELRKSGINLNSVVNGTTALISAVKQNSVNLVKTLLKDGANPNIADKVGNTPLMAAITNENADIVRQLIKAGLQPQVPVAGGPKIDAIYSAENIGILKDLLAKRDKKSKTISADKPALEKAARLVGAINADNSAIVDALLRAGADLTIQNKEGDTALSLAKKVANEAVVTKLKEHMAKDAK